MPTWSGYADIRLAGGDHHAGRLTVTAVTAARAVAAATQEAIDEARRVLGSDAGEVYEVGLSLTRDGA